MAVILCAAAPGVARVNHGGRHLHNATAMRASSRSLHLLLACACAALAGTAAAQDALPLPVQQALARAGLPEDALAAVALPLGHHAPAWQHRAKTPMQPGSTMKLVTSIVALDRLGPNLRGHTEL
ncbi:MAG: D-alanyl-D-alanine carboxypeptidase, partial [Hylemonella sp.]